MPFVTITDPVEAHRYRQEGLLWFYSRLSKRWVALTSEHSRKTPLEDQIENMRELSAARYAILVEEDED